MAAYLIDGLFSLVVLVGILAIVSHQSLKGAPGDVCAILRSRSVNAGTSFNSTCVQLGSHAWVWKRGGFFTAVGLAALVSFLNVMVLQTIKGASIGKLAVGFRVVNEQGQHADFGRMLARWLLLVFIDGAVFLVGLITVLVTHPHRRVGDIAAGTYVVSKENVGRPIGLVPSMGRPPVPAYAPAPEAPAYGRPVPGWGPPPAPPAPASPPPAPQWAPPGTPTPPPVTQWPAPAGAPAAPPPPAPAPPAAAPWAPPPAAQPPRPCSRPVRAAATPAELGRARPASAGCTASCRAAGSTAAGRAGVDASTGPAAHRAARSTASRGSPVCRASGAAVAATRVRRGDGAEGRSVVGPARSPPSPHPTKSPTRSERRDGRTGPVPARAARYAHGDVMHTAERVLRHATLPLLLVVGVLATVAGNWLRVQNVDPQFAMVLVQRTMHFGGTFYDNAVQDHGPLEPFLYDVAARVGGPNGAWYVISAYVTLAALALGYVAARTARFTGATREVAMAAGAAVFVHFTISRSNYAGVFYIRNMTTVLLALAWLLTIDDRCWSSRRRRRLAVIGAGALLGLAVQSLLSTFAAGVLGLLAIGIAWTRVELDERLPLAGLIAGSAVVTLVERADLLRGAR